MFKKLSRHAAAATIFALAVGAGTAAAQTAPTQTTPATAPTQTPVAATTPAPSTAGHEYAPLIEQKINYKDWTFKSLKDGSPVNLREWVKGKKLVMVVYFAPWCGNWKMEAPVVARLLDKYRKHGFDVVAVNEYASADDARKYFDSQGGAPYTVVVESEGREARDKTTHYGYRQIANDTRRWGSPFNVFLEPSRLNAKGDVLAEKTWVVGGELIEKDAEQFIREKLGLTEKSAVEPCEVKP
ncbi:MAG: TlpA family protein disulfide reductase [Acidobacteria bacterium]|nr:TlpA family protein disulfide reductase [Acidobacteriota bacterium]